MESVVAGALPSPIPCCISGAVIPGTKCGQSQQTMPLVCWFLFTIGKNYEFSSAEIHHQRGRNIFDHVRNSGIFFGFFP